MKYIAVGTVRGTSNAGGRFVTEPRARFHCNRVQPGQTAEPHIAWNYFMAGKTEHRGRLEANESPR